MAGIAGSPYFDIYLDPQKLGCPNSSFHYDLILIQSWDWTLEEIRYSLFMVCHEVRAGACQSPIEPLSRDWHSDSVYLRALLMEICSHNLF